MNKPMISFHHTQSVSKYRYLLSFCVSFDTQGNYILIYYILIHNVLINSQHLREHVTHTFGRNDEQHLKGLLEHSKINFLITIYCKINERREDYIH